MKNIRIFIWKLSDIVVKFSIYLYRCVFVMGEGEGEGRGWGGISINSR